MFPNVRVSAAELNSIVEAAVLNKRNEVTRNPRDSREFGTDAECGIRQILARGELDLVILA